jgi:hypothetical protein
VDDLAAKQLTPALRIALDRVIRPLRDLLERSNDLVTRVDDPRIALECAVIRAMCVRLTDRLAREDPLAHRVVLSKPAAGALAAGAILRGLARRRHRATKRPAALAT